MKKRKTFLKVFTGKLLISVPIILIIIFISCFALNQYSESVLRENMDYIAEPTLSRFLQSEKESTFAENNNFLKFRINLALESTLAQFPGMKGYMYVNDSDNNLIMDTSPAWTLMQTIRDENYELLKRNVYICDYETLCRFEEVREVINGYNEQYDSTLLEFLIPHKETFKHIEILEGYVDEETLKVYPTKVEITTERIPSWAGDLNETGEFTTDIKTFSMPLENTEGLLPYRYDTETYTMFLDGEEIHGLHLTTGRNLTLDDYQKISRRPFSSHLTRTVNYTDASGNEYVITVKLTDDFLKTYLSFIILLSIIYFLADMIVCFILSNLSYSKLKVFYQNEDYRKALMSSMAHDLKTPLTVMSGYAENLKENIQTDKREHYADAILENTNYMNGIITDVLGLAKLEENTVKGGHEKMDFCDIASKQAERIKPLLEEKNIKLSVEGSYKRNADRASLERVMDNLLSNAAKYTKDGGNINIYAKDTPFSKHIFVIENTPIDAINVKPQKLWEPFVKGDESRSDKNGTGLGLSIVKNILVNLGFKSKIKIKDGWFRVIIK